MRSTWPVLGLKLLLVLAPSVVSAHGTGPPNASFAAGAKHVLTEPDHFLAMLALALLAGQAGGRALAWTPAGLSAGLVIGALSGSAFRALPQVEAVNLASVAILGALVALGARLPHAFPAGCGLVFGWGHGYANVLDLGGRMPPQSFVLGVTAGALLLVVSVSVTTSFLRMRWQMIAVRAVGSWICAIGLMVFALQFASD